MRGMVGARVALGVALIGMATGCNRPPAEVVAEGAPGWQICIEDGQIPALDDAVRRRIPDASSYRRSSMRLAPSGDGRYVEAVVVFSANDARAVRLDGMAVGRIHQSSCVVSNFDWVCLQPEFMGAGERQLMCTNGEPDPAIPPGSAS